MKLPHAQLVFEKAIVSHRERCGDLRHDGDCAARGERLGGGEAQMGRGLLKQLGEMGCGLFRAQPSECACCQGRLLQILSFQSV